MIYINYLTDEERWKPILYEDIRPGYMVSDRGRVRKEDGTIINVKAHTSGYYRLHLRLIDGSRKKFLVHRLLLMNWNPIKNMHSLLVNHKDLDRGHNVLTNLEWVTHKGNSEHAALNGCYYVGEDNNKSTYTNEQVHEICRLFSEGIDAPGIILHMGLTGDRPSLLTSLHRINSRKNWRHISKLYEWGNVTSYKIYSKEFIEELSKRIAQGYRTYKICGMYSHLYDSEKLRHIIRNIKMGTTHKTIMESAMLTRGYHIISDGKIHIGAVKG